MPVPRCKLWYSYQAAHDEDVQRVSPLRIGFRMDNGEIVEYTCSESADEMPSSYNWPDKQLVLVASDALIQERRVVISENNFDQI